MRIGVVTDSASDLPAALAAQWDIAVVPLEVRLGAHAPETIVSLDGDAFWKLQAETSALAETSAPSPGQFAEAYESCAARGCDAVVCVTISSKLSATHQAAVTGASAVNGLRVKVIDSESATMGEGIVALEAARAAREGAGPDEVRDRAVAASTQVRVLGTLDTLENLRRGGRIGTAQAFLGSLLSIKPVIEIKDGVVEGESKQRTRVRSLQYLADKALQAGPFSHLAVVHAAAPDLDVVLDLLRPAAPASGIVVNAIGPVVGTHTGPGTIGVCWLPTT